MCLDPSCASDGGARDACAADGCRLDAGAQCGPGAYPLTRQAHSLLLVLDDGATLVPWYTQLYDELIQFLQDSGSSGLAVGLQRFDLACEPSAYYTPLVPIAPLPGNFAALEREIPPAALNLSTSTVPAVLGTLESARRWAREHPSERIAVVLITDTTPSDCDGLAGDYEMVTVDAVSGARLGSPSIPTYVVGLGSLLTADAIAAAGGTTTELVSILPAPGEILAKFQNIRDEARGCSFAWPAGLTLATDSQVLISPASGPARRFDIQDSSAACAVGRDGFYIVDPSAAFPLQACPNTCAAIAAGDQLALSSACSAR